MKTSVYMTGLILLLAVPLHSETYSWVDDGGTYNFTEDFSRVPPKYRKKVKRSEDMQQEAPSKVSPVSGNVSGQSEKTDVRSAAVPDGGNELYGGKSRTAWRKELDECEAELNGIEQHMEQVRKQISDPKGVSKAQFEMLKKDYDDNRAAYDQKYKSYTGLIETIRKAGIPVEIKK